MSELLLGVAARRLVGDKVDELIYNHGAGTGPWYHGAPMSAGAARQVRLRGGDPTAFRARHVRAEYIEFSDLILTATREQSEFVVELVADAYTRTFVLGEFGRLLSEVDVRALPPLSVDPEAVYARGRALVKAVHTIRQGDMARESDDLEDPWGQEDHVFSRVADTIEQTTIPLASVLFGGAVE